MATKKKRRYGGVTLPVLRCLNPKCRHRWIPRVGQPEECPKCKGRRWEKAGTYSNGSV